jgi:hypothetical protein
MKARTDGAAVDGPQPYALAKSPVAEGENIDEAEVQRLAVIARSVIEQEGPVHRDEIARRVRSFFGHCERSVRAAAAIADALDLLAKMPDLCRDDGFWFTKRQRKAPPVRHRADAPPTLRRLDRIAPIEIKAAIELARAETTLGSGTDLANAVARLFGLPPKRTMRNLIHSLLD